MAEVKIESLTSPTSYRLVDVLPYSSKDLPNASSKSIEVVVKDLMSIANDKQIDVLSAILQSVNDTASRAIDNMTLTREEREALEERRTRIEKIRQLLEDKKLEEDEALKMLELLLPIDDRELLKAQLVAHSSTFV